MKILTTPTHLREQDRSDEIQSDVSTQRVGPGEQPLVPGGDRIDSSQRPPGTTTAPSPNRASGAEDLLAVKAANGHVQNGGLDRVEFEDRLQTLATRELSPAAQKEFIGYLEAKRPSPEALSWVASKVRESLPHDDQNRTGPLRRYLNSKGIKLFANDKLGNNDSGLAVDRKAFRAELDTLAKNGGVVDKRAARGILARLKGVVDKGDLLWAQRQLQLRVQSGELRFAGTDAKTGARDPYAVRIDEMIAAKTGGAVNEKEIGDAIREARKSGFDAASMHRIYDLLARCGDDPDVLFAAQRTYKREVAEAQNAVTKEARKSRRQAAYLRDKAAQDPAQAAALTQQAAALETRAAELEAGAAPKISALGAIVAQLDAELAPRLADKVDKKTMRRETMDRYRRGEISRAEASGMMSVVAMSRTNSELAYSTMSMFHHLAIYEGWQELQQAWDEMMESFRRNMSDDTYDSSGNLIETAQERYLRRDLKERQLERLEKISDKIQELAQRASLRGQHASVRSRMSQAKDPGHVSTLRNAEANLEAERADVDRVV